MWEWVPREAKMRRCVYWVDVASPVLAPTEALNDVLDVNQQQVTGVAVHILWSIRGAITTQVYSYHMEPALELSKLVAPGEPAR